MYILTWHNNLEGAISFNSAQMSEIIIHIKQHIALFPAMVSYCLIVSINIHSYPFAML